MSELPNDITDRFDVIRKEQLRKIKNDEHKLFLGVDFTDDEKIFLDTMFKHNPENIAEFYKKVWQALGATYDLKEDKYSELKNNLLNNSNAKSIYSWFFGHQIISKEERRVLINIIYTLRFAFLRNEELDKLVEGLDEVNNNSIDENEISKNNQKENNETREEFLDKLKRTLRNKMEKEISEMSDNDKNNLINDTKERAIFIRNYINDYLREDTKYKLIKKEKANLFIELDEEVIQYITGNS